MTVVTSKISPVVIGQGRNKETIYTATRTTKLADGTYDVEVMQKVLVVESLQKEMV